MQHQVVSPDDWLAARSALLARETAFTKERVALSRERRRLPWAKVDKSYAFQGPAGDETLADLLDGRSQLLVYHFLFRLEGKLPELLVLGGQLRARRAGSKPATSRWSPSRARRSSIRRATGCVPKGRNEQGRPIRRPGCDGTTSTSPEKAARDCRWPSLGRAS
jgi:hypothetical protein